MKLIDMLVRDLTQWPSDANFIVQCPLSGAYLFFPVKPSNPNGRWGASTGYVGASHPLDVIYSSVRNNTNLQEIADDAEEAIIKHSDYSFGCLQQGLGAGLHVGSWVRNYGKARNIDQTRNYVVRTRDGKIAACSGAILGIADFAIKHTNDDIMVIAVLASRFYPLPPKTEVNLCLEEGEDAVVEYVDLNLNLCRGNARELTMDSCHMLAYNVVERFFAKKEDPVEKNPDLIAMRGRINEIALKRVELKVKYDEEIAALSAEEKLLTDEIKTHGFQLFSPDIPKSSMKQESSVPWGVGDRLYQKRNSAMNRHTLYFVHSHDDRLGITDIRAEMSNGQIEYFRITDAAVIENFELA